MPGNVLIFTHFIFQRFKRKFSTLPYFLAALWQVQNPLCSSKILYSVQRKRGFFYYMVYQSSLSSLPFISLYNVFCLWQDERSSTITFRPRKSYVALTHAGCQFSDSERKSATSACRFSKAIFYSCLAGRERAISRRKSRQFCE